ncbi:MBL fold metallo-hydrolase [Nitrospirillum pindoramense]|uniref:Glyoxylase-like metal-dependent hydrolase (Beta-lactamase superfamily II) n=1 Tax=Nitrospirillum amazonense TaxID=28077 RepID=A0A560GXA4_9PROT|nr:MBL fold metallo-hydrolase [Nitrospirillum amazonense]TWB38642.1 glyoxylase-like metal-dependent hydrolase (beta-lactamase superfamily II) [Nitrospirillum amazonense]
MPDQTVPPASTAPGPSAPGMPPLKVAILPVTPFQQNCSILWCTATKRAAVVDPGDGVTQIEEFLARQGLTLERILVTHGHVDHAAAVADLTARTGVPVDGPQQEDKFWIDRLPEDGAKYGMLHAKPFTPTRWLGDGDTVAVGDLVLDVLHCPGHTPGHVVFIHQPSRLAIVGDVIFQGSIGRTDFPRGDHAALIRSIREKLFPLGDDITFLPGHGEPSTFGQERRTNPFVSDRAVARG